MQLCTFLQLEVNIKLNAFGPAIRRYSKQYCALHRLEESERRFNNLFTGVKLSKRRFMDSYQAKL